MTLFERIIELCDANKITPERLGEAIGISSSSIRKWKTVMPSVAKVAAVAEYFNVSIDYLMGLTDVPYRSTKEIMKMDVLYRSKHDCFDACLNDLNNRNEFLSGVWQYVELTITWTDPVSGHAGVRWPDGHEDVVKIVREDRRRC